MIRKMNNIDVWWVERRSTEALTENKLNWVVLRVTEVLESSALAHEKELRSYKYFLILF